LCGYVSSVTTVNLHVNIGPQSIDWHLVWAAG